MTTLEPKTNVRPNVARLVPPARAATPQPCSLAEAVQTAARAVDANTLMSVAPQDAGLACQPRTLLTLLTYCYARQTYGSADIQALLRRDANFRALCREESPDTRMLRRFRRENRGPLQACLEAALRFMAEQKVAEGFVTRVNEGQIAEEARRRIIMAMFVDSMELDGGRPSDAPTDICYLFANNRAAVH